MVLVRSPEDCYMICYANHNNSLCGQLSYHRGILLSDLFWFPWKQEFSMDKNVWSKFDEDFEKMLSVKFHPNWPPGYRWGTKGDHNNSH